MRRCEACERPLGPAARFCPACGAPTDEEVARRSAAARARDETASRAVQAIAIVIGGTLASLLLTTLWWIEELGRWTEFGFYLLLLPVAALAVWRLGRGGLRASLAARPRPAWVLVGALLGVPVIAVGHVYVEWLNDLVGGEDLDLFLEGDRAWLLLTVAVLPALFEELLDRGILWEASSRVLSPAKTLLLTSALFTISHGLQGSYLAYPHRFVAGLVFGWLRLKSGSVVPGIVAHLVCNGTWVLLST